MGEQIPRSIKNFTIELTKLCAKHKLRDFSGNFDTQSWSNEDVRDWHRVKFSFTQGRHGVHSKGMKVYLDKTYRARLNLDGKEVEFYGE